MKSIYDMMGKYTYPCMQEDAPREHVESFFQVSNQAMVFIKLCNYSLLIFFLICTESIIRL